MLQALVAAFPAAHPMLLATQANYEQWKQVRRRGSKPSGAALFQRWLHFQLFVAARFQLLSCATQAEAAEKQGRNSNTPLPKLHGTAPLVADKEKRSASSSQVEGSGGSMAMRLYMPAAANGASHPETKAAAIPLGGGKAESLEGVQAAAMLRP